VDVLITLLDDYDITKAFAIHRNEVRNKRGIKSTIKPTLITIAWIQNWFGRWLSQPWIGNYDLLLTSSKISKDFYREIISKIGLQVKCAMGCPRLDFSTVSLKFENKDLKLASSDSYSLSSDRVFVPVEVFPLAVDHLTFNPYTNDTLFLNSQHAARHGNAVEQHFHHSLKADYVFTGSFWGHYRKVMDFDPASIPQWKGSIIGGNWDSPLSNVTKAWLDISGKLPYELLSHV
jgi:hypothetical protein